MVPRYAAEAIYRDFRFTGTIYTSVGNPATKPLLIVSGVELANADLRYLSTQD